jgi:hypothetical protein
MKWMTLELRRLGVIWWRAVIVVALVGCKPTQPPTVRGEVELHLERISDSETTFSLANGLDRSISVRGERGVLQTIQMWPPDATIACRTESSLLQEDPASTSDPIPKDIEIRRGERVTVSIQSSFPQRSKGRRCVLFLMLTDGTKVQPLEFVP